MSSEEARVRMQRLGKLYGQATARAWDIAKSAKRNRITSADMKQAMAEAGLPEKKLATPR